MIQRMTAKPLKLLMSATLAVAMTATPMAADTNYHRDRSSDNDTGALIAALLGLATLGVILSKKDGHHEPVYRPDPHKPAPKKPAPKVDPAFFLPGKCLREFRTQYGPTKYWGSICLKGNYRYNSRLPQSCYNTIVIRDRYDRYVTRGVYEPTCMRSLGFKTARR